MKWSFTHLKSMGPHVMRHFKPYRLIGEKQFDCPSMVVFLNMLLKYYHAHNIHHSPLDIPFQILDVDFAIQY